MNTNHRIIELRRRLDEAGIDVLIITNLLNVRYLTGFSGSAGSLIISSASYTSDSPGILFTDSRYMEQSEQQVNESGSGALVEIVIGNLSRQYEMARLFAAKSSKTAIEGDSTSLTSFYAWTSALEKTIAVSEVKVETQRQCKDDSEIDAIRRACQIADQALEKVLPRLKDEPTEIEFAAELEFHMRMLGAQGPSFDTIVASGPHSAMPHARPTDKRIIEGDPVVVDFGAIWDGYHSDCTRTYFLGSTPSRQFKRVYEAVEASQLAGSATALVGTAASKVDNACRDSLHQAGLDEFFTHSTGHGVGLEVHELPWIHKDNKSALSVGDVMTVEPGVYLPGEMGVRIEDTIAISQSGSERLTNIAKSPLIY